MVSNALTILQMEPNIGKMLPNIFLTKYRLPDNLEKELDLRHYGTGKAGDTESVVEEVRNGLEQLVGTIDVKPPPISNILDLELVLKVCYVFKFDVPPEAQASPLLEQVHDFFSLNQLLVHYDHRVYQYNYLNHILEKPLRWLDECSYEEINLAAEMADRIQDNKLTEAWVRRVFEAVNIGKDGVALELFKRLQKCLIVHVEATKAVFDLLPIARTCHHQMLHDGLLKLTPPDQINDLQNSILQGIFEEKISKLMMPYLATFLKSNMPWQFLIKAL